MVMPSVTMNISRPSNVGLVSLVVSARSAAACRGAGSVWAIGALGFPGVSAAGISSGLAAVGGVVSGGMAAGTMLTIAAPAVGVAMLGCLVYRLSMWLENLAALDSLLAALPTR
jgi:hypothetical protein